MDKFFIGVGLLIALANFAVGNVVVGVLCTITSFLLLAGL